MTGQGRHAGRPLLAGTRRGAHAARRGLPVRAWLRRIAAGAGRILTFGRGPERCLCDPPVPAVRWLRPVLRLPARPGRRGCRAAGCIQPAPACTGGRAGRAAHGHGCRGRAVTAAAEVVAGCGICGGGHGMPACPVLAGHLDSMRLQGRSELYIRDRRERPAAGRPAAAHAPAGRGPRRPAGLAGRAAQHGTRRPAARPGRDRREGQPAALLLRLGGQDRAGHGQPGR